MSQRSVPCRRSAYSRSETVTSDESFLLFSTKSAPRRYDKHRPAAADGVWLVMASRITVSK